MASSQSSVQIQNYLGREDLYFDLSRLDVGPLRSAIF